MRALLRSALALLALTLAQDAAGQFAQYTQPGGGPASNVPNQEEVERQVEEARWHFGGLRVAPWFGLQNLSYVDNAFAGTEEGVADITATAGAGVSAYLPTGPDVVWVAEGGVSYFWWSEVSERRQLGGRAGLGVYGDFNRLGVAIRGGRRRDEQLRTSEVPQETLAETDFALANFTLRLGSKLDLFAGGSRLSFEDLSDEVGDPRSVDLSGLDRDETLLNAGIGWSPTDKVRIAVGVEQSTVEFAPGAVDQSNEGTAPTLQLRLDGNRIGVRAGLARRSLEPRDGSLFEPFDQETGSIDCELELSSNLRAHLYGHRSLVYSVLEGFDSFTADRYGLSLMAPLGRIGVTAFFESGENAYRPVPGSPARSDQVVAYGISSSLEFREFLLLTLGASETDYDSNLPGSDRSVGSIKAGLSLSVDSLIWR